MVMAVVGMLSYKEIREEPFRIMYLSLLIGNK
jgi:hypothetical protein